MQLKGIQTFYKNKIINIELPDKKSIVLNGTKKECTYILDLLRTMLGVDYNDNLRYLENRSEDVLKNNASIRFTTGSILLKDGTITIHGRVPYLHVVMVDNSGDINSFLVSQSASPIGLATDMTKYNTEIEHTDWIRLLELFNRYAGFDCCTLVELADSTYKLEFTDLTPELETVYLLMSESFLTPQDYLRIVLLPDIKGVTPERMFELIELVDNINKLEMIISSADVEIKGNTVVTNVSC